MFHLYNGIGLVKSPSKYKTIEAIHMYHLKVQDQINYLQQKKCGENASAVLNRAGNSWLVSKTMIRELDFFYVPCMKSGMSIVQFLHLNYGLSSI